VITLYHHPLSLYCVKVRLLLEELGCAYESKFVDIGKGEQRLPEFLHKNPFGRVPMIEVDGFAVAESSAILRYLAEKFGPSELWPHSLEARTAVDQWVEIFGTDVCEPFSDLIWYKAWAPKYNAPVDPAAVAKAEAALAKVLPVCEAHLMGRHYFVGPSPTLADLVFLPFAANAWRARIDFAQYSRLKSWLSRMSDRPAWQRVNVTDIKI
jgi:glutathione S-transferase